METRQLGDIVINRILELEAPFVRPLEFFDEALPEVVEPHRNWLEPNALDPETGKMIMPVQSYLIRTRHHTILIDTCIGCRKSYNGVLEWKDRRDETWLNNLAIAGVKPKDIDYVFCTHLHVDHCGWNTRLMDGRWRRLSPMLNISSQQMNMQPARPVVQPSSARTCYPLWKLAKRCWFIRTMPSTTKFG
jgi:hypothetical protein